MNKDVIDDRYARLFELPNCLADEFEVGAFCLDYHRWKPDPIPDDLKGTWARASLPGTLYVGWLISLARSLRKLRPQVVIASSDCVHVILGSFVAWLLGARFYADLYDDYSTFGIAKVPGISALYQRALRRADGVVVVSSTLGQHMQALYPGKPTLVLESTIDDGAFQPRDKEISLRMMGLEELVGNKTVGICGGLNSLHGADIVYDAFEPIAAENRDVAFVVAGKLYGECPLPDREDVKYLGMLSHADMSHFYSAMDVVVVPLADNRFGYFAFPQKVYEVLACESALVAADVGALSKLFEATPEVLYKPNSPASLALRVTEQLAKPTVHKLQVPTWRSQSLRLSEFVSA